MTVGGPLIGAPGGIWLIGGCAVRDQPPCVIAPVSGPACGWPTAGASESGPAPGTLPACGPSAPRSSARIGPAAPRLAGDRGTAGAGRAVAPSSWTAPAAACSCVAGPAQTARAWRHPPAALPPRAMAPPPAATPRRQAPGPSWMAPRPASPARSRPAARIRLASPGRDRRRRGGGRRGGPGGGAADGLLGGWCGGLRSLAGGRLGRAGRPGEPRGGLRREPGARGGGPGAAEGGGRAVEVITANGG